MSKSEDLLVAAVKARLVSLRRRADFFQWPRPTMNAVYERAPISPPAYCGPLLPAPWRWLSLGRPSTGDARHDHNRAVMELWKRIPCPGCGGAIVAGWGVWPDEPVDPAKPPTFCYGCDLRRIRQEPRPCFVPFVDEDDFFAAGGARLLG